VNIILPCQTSVLIDGCDPLGLFLGEIEIAAHSVRVHIMDPPTFSSFLFMSYECRHPYKLEGFSSKTAQHL